MSPLSHHLISDNGGTSPTIISNDNVSCQSQYQTTGTGIPMRNHDGTIMLDHRGKIVYRSQFLSTHPLRSECKQRVGYASKMFTYVSGEGVIRSMNAAFGIGGWGTEVTMERLVMCEEDDQGRWVVGYLCTVRVTLTHGGVSHEDCGSGEGINDNKIKAHEKAMKSAVTDAMKRAARHFGERLGNALYIKGNSIQSAPKDNKAALLALELQDALGLYGDQNKIREDFCSKSDDDNDNDEEVDLTAAVKRSPVRVTHISSPPSPTVQDIQNDNKCVGPSISSDEDESTVRNTGRNNVSSTVSVGASVNADYQSNQNNHKTPSYGQHLPKSGNTPRLSETRQAQNERSSQLNNSRPNMSSIRGASVPVNTSTPHNPPEQVFANNVVEFNATISLLPNGNVTPLDNSPAYQQRQPLQDSTSEPPREPFDAARPIFSRARLESTSTLRQNYSELFSPGLSAAGNLSSLKRSGADSLVVNTNKKPAKNPYCSRPT